MGRLQVLVHEAGLVGLAQGHGDADREAKEAPRLNGRADEPSERLAAVILEHQHGTTVFAHEFQRPRRPSAVQLIFQLIFVREPIEDERRRVFRGDEHRQHGVPAAPGARARSSTEKGFAFLRQDVEALIHRRCTAKRGSSPGLPCQAAGRYLGQAATKALRPRLPPRRRFARAAVIKCRCKTHSKGQGLGT